MESRHYLLSLHRPLLHQHLLSLHRSLLHQRDSVSGRQVAGTGGTPSARHRRRSLVATGVAPRRPIPYLPPSWTPLRTPQRMPPSMSPGRHCRRSPDQALRRHAGGGRHRLRRARRRNGRPAPRWDQDAKHQRDRGALPRPVAAGSRPTVPPAGTAEAMSFHRQRVAVALGQVIDDNDVPGTSMGASFGASAVASMTAGDRGSGGAAPPR